MNPYLGMMFPFAGTFAMTGFALCNGATLSIAQNTALFSLLGTTYGGNGVSTFQLPDLQGRTMIGAGQLSGGSNYIQGQRGGTENQTLTTNNLPAHSHSFNVNNLPGDLITPATGSYLAAGPLTGSGPNASQLKSYSDGTPNQALGSFTIGNTGSTIPFSVLSPYVTVTYVIALQGIYPSRN
jgi:microcystin-dependent protein